MGVGLDWIRSHPTPISADLIHQANPPAEWMDQYLDFAPALMLHYNGMNELAPWMAHSPEAPWISWVWKDGTSNGQVLTGEQYPGRIGYQIGDEPSNILELQELEQGIGAVKAQDPDGLTIINMGPGASQWVFNGAAEIADVISVDCYRLNKEIYRPLGRCRQAALDANVPYWCWLDSRGQQSDRMWTAMTHVAFGFTGFSWFIYQTNVTEGGGSEFVAFFDAPASYEALPTAAWSEAREINRILAQFGKWLPWVWAANVRYITPQSWFGIPAGMTRWTSSNTGDPHIVAIDPGGGDLVFTWFQSVVANDGIVLLQNCRHAGGPDEYTNGTQNAQITVAFDSSVSKIRTFNKVNGSVGEKPVVNNQVEFFLPAGEALAFKYDNGIPWPGIEQ